MENSVWFKKEFFAVALVFLLFSGCGGVGDVTTGDESSTGTRISLYWPDGYSYDHADGSITIIHSGKLSSTLPAYVTSMTLIISGEGIDPPVTFNVPLDTLTVNFAVTPGIRIFTILISTSIPGLSFTASQTIELVAGEQVNLDFKLVINAPPVVDSVSVSDSTPQTRSAISVSCNATDPDGNPMSYSWSDGGARGRFGGSGATVSYTAVRGGSITITCTASDGKGGEGEGSVTVIANTSPVINSVTASDTSPDVGDTITLTCDASDPDGDRLSYAWSDGLGSGSQVTYTVTSAGSKTFTCTVSDGKGGTASGSATINGASTSTRVLIAGLFADASLQTCVDTLATTNGWIYADEVTGALDCSGVGPNIVSLSGMEYLTNFTSLDLGSNLIVDLSPLSGLTNLTSLKLNNNNITDVSPLSGLTNLTVLDLYINSIVNVSPLAGMTALTQLQIHVNNIIDVSPFASMTNLTLFWVTNNSIGGQNVGKVDSLVTLTGAQVYLSNNLTMSCAEAHVLICGVGNTVVAGTCSPGSTGLGTNVDISADGTGTIDTPAPGTNCTNP
ncbi:internalin, putative [hydrothermal vent metagenome]|uniref:Internalin, putative n=1 Tax=hydrothermal vent metagenome TaxID=652676 RepID=A0A3B1CM96_9ZZZZ